MRAVTALAALLLASGAHAQSAPATVDAPVLAHVVERGELLSAGDFTTAQLSTASARGATAPADAAGMEANRRLQAGAVVRSGDLIPPQLVRRGEPVSLSVRSGSLSITAPGRALSSGAAGDMVRVVNTVTSRTLDGIVEAGGRVRIASY